MSDLVQRQALVRTTRSGETRFNRTEIELHHRLVLRGLLRARVTPQTERARTRLHPSDEFRRPARSPQIRQRRGIHRKPTGRRTVLWRHVRERRAILHGKRLKPGPEKLHHAVHHAVRAQPLRQHQRRVGCRRAGREPAAQPHPDHPWRRQRNGLPQHRRLGLDAADPPSQHAEAVDHRRVRVSPDHRVRYQHPSTVRQRLHADHFGQMLHVDLMADAETGRKHAQTPERGLTPAQKLVSLPIAFELDPHVLGQRLGRAGRVNLNRVINHQIYGDHGFHAARRSAPPYDLGTKSRKICDARHAGEVLQQHARRPERHLHAVAR